LPLEVIGRRNDCHPVDDALRDEFNGKPEGEGGLACTGRRRRKKVAPFTLEIEVKGLGLPGPELAGRTARSALREGGREMLSGKSSDGAREPAGGRRRRIHLTKL
jgi:hypothetical protein